MNITRLRRPRAAPFLMACVLPSLASGPLADEPAAPGDLWEVTSQMSMAALGFSMPAQKLKVCAARTWTRPPGGDDAQRGCTSENVAFADDTVTWVSSCRDGMTGTGTITRDGEDAYHGEIRYASDDGDIVIKLDGRRIGGCDNPQ